MSDTIHLTMTHAAALLAGVLLGAIFFGGLWWTIQKGLSAKQPALWFSLSFLLRTAIALVGFYLVSGAGSDWIRLLACLFGFIIARITITRLARLPVSAEVNHAP